MEEKEQEKKAKEARNEVVEQVDRSGEGEKGSCQVQ